jgi:carboxylesterase
MTELMSKEEKSAVFCDPKTLYCDELALVSESFYFPGTNGRAVLLIHGWTTTPYELRRLGQYLNEKGYAVSAPLLTGHGTKPQDLENVKWEKWLEDVDLAYAELKKNHEKVYVIGTSLGASLSSILAGNNPEISGLVLMAMPYAVRMEKFASFCARILSLFKKYSKKYYPPSFGSKATVTRRISYQIYPIKSAFEVYGLIKFSRKNLHKINQPCFIMQSSIDHIVAKGSLEKIYNKISSVVKKKKYIEKAYHTFISDTRNENVFEDILHFLDEN